MQKKHLIGAGITAFSVILGLLWLIPLIWLIGTAFSVPPPCTAKIFFCSILPYDTVPDNSVHTG